MHAFHYNEQYRSQIPALQMLMKLGYEYLSPPEALVLRGGKTGNFILEDVLHTQIQRFNRIHYRAKEYHFSEANIQEAVQKIKHVPFEGLQKTNEAIYDLLTLGVTLEQTIEGTKKSYNLKYIDWENPTNNIFHVVPEYVVDCSRSKGTIRPDIVLFVNGIPLCTIECKKPSVDVEEALTQQMRNQETEYAPKFFTYMQLLIAANTNVFRYATVGTPKKFWSLWKEREDTEKHLEKIVQRPLSEKHTNHLFAPNASHANFSASRNFFDELEQAESRLVTEQDRGIYSLCRPERLLDLVYRFILVEHGEKKIARYQQFFAVRSSLKRLKQRNEEGQRRGGVIWHTQGSGKSLTMVMLARALVLDKELVNPRLLLVTDRKDLDIQLGKTFIKCGLAKQRATSGAHLTTLLKEKAPVITSLVHKFDKALASEKYQDMSSDIFVFVDESHRSQYDNLAIAMRKMLPNACYFGFTGTPLLRKNKKNTFAKFGNLINPSYSMQQAVEDKAVLPLLYEGRYVEMEQDQKAIDLWFDRHTEGLTEDQKADLKRKYARAEMLTKTEKVIYMQAYDIFMHYRTHWQGTGFKAQLVAPTKAVALQYHKHFKSFQDVSTEVIISAPATKEAEGENEESIPEVVTFWKTMMGKYGSEDKYTESIIEKFKHGEEPEILIVVSKLLTGFDAPRNTVLYLCKKMEEHTLLQAIARVNRLHEAKDFGYIIDYASILGKLDQALTMYQAFEGFDAEDLIGVLQSVHDEVAKLPQAHAALWDIFKGLNKTDAEAFERFLADRDIREEFYTCLSMYSKILAIALSTDKFIRDIDDLTLKQYKDDLKRFINLKMSVKLRYAESIDYRDYEPKIKKLLDAHIKANEVLQLNEPVNIFDARTFEEVKQGCGIHSKSSAAARADMIAYATKKVISEKMAEDPTLFEKFSKLIQAAIDAFKAQRISDMEYLNRVSEIREDVVLRRHNDMPESIQENDEACAYYGVVLSCFAEHALSQGLLEDSASKTALAIQTLIADHLKVDFWLDEDAKKNVINAIEDFLYDEVKKEFNVPLTPSQMDTILEKTMDIAKSRWLA